MKVTNLRARPEKYQDTLSLIEAAFGYERENSFEVDFYPLIKKSNWDNCWVIEDKKEVVAHTAVVEKKFKIKQEFFSAHLIGGVAVDEKYRGQGLSRKLIEHVLQTYSSGSLYILWSEKTELYKKHKFHPCFELHERPQTNAKSSFLQASLGELSSDDLRSIITLYNSPSLNEVRVFRSERDWEDLKRVTSAKLFIKREENQITNYFFMDKGQDLGGVIHEYGDLKDAEEMASHGRLWSTKESKGSTALFGALVRPGKMDEFSKLAQAYAGLCLETPLAEENVSFSYQGTDFDMSLESFLQGLFGPGRFQELDGLPKFSVCGLDSV